MAKMKSSVLVPIDGALSFGQAIVRVIVDDNEKFKVFYVDEVLICARSQFFRNALNGPSENTVKVVDLDEDPDTFQMYLSLVYTGKIACKVGGVKFLELKTDADSDDKESCEPDEEPYENGDDGEASEDNYDNTLCGGGISDVHIPTSEDSEKENETDDKNDDNNDDKNVGQADQFGFLVKLYLLSDKLMDTNAIHTIMEGLIETAKDVRCLDTQWMRYAFENTHQGSALRRWLLDVMVEGPPEALQSIEEVALPKTFWYEAAQTTAMGRELIPMGARRWEEIGHYSAKGQELTASPTEEAIKALSTVGDQED